MGYLYLSSIQLLVAVRRRLNALLMHSYHHTTEKCLPKTQIFYLQCTYSPNLLLNDGRLMNSPVWREIDEDSIRSTWLANATVWYEHMTLDIVSLFIRIGSTLLDLLTTIFRRITNTVPCSCIA